MFNFCMDRGAGHQLEDVRHSSYGPWRRGVEGIFKEERMHIRHGELWVKRLAEDPATRDEAERTLPQVVRPHHEHLRASRHAPGTASTRSSASSAATTTRCAGRSPTRSGGLTEAQGWRLPEWKPAWDKLPEEAQIPG